MKNFFKRMDDRLYKAIFESREDIEKSLGAKDLTIWQVIYGFIGFVIALALFVIIFSNL